MNLLINMIKIWVLPLKRNNSLLCIKMNLMSLLKKIDENILYKINLNNQKQLYFFF